MSKKVKLKDVFTAIDSGPIERICMAILLDDKRTFDLLLPQIEDVDADNGRILRTCVENDRFTMAKAVFMRGGVSVTAMVGLRDTYDRAVDAYNKKPSGKDAAERAEMDRAQLLISKLETWKTCFHEEVLPVLAMNKMQDLQNQIAALRTEIAEVITPARAVIKKPSGTAAP